MTTCSCGNRCRKSVPNTAAMSSAARACTSSSPVWAPVVEAPELHPHPGQLARRDRAALLPRRAGDHPRAAPGTRPSRGSPGRAASARCRAASSAGGAARAGSAGPRRSRSRSRGSSRVPSHAGGREPRPVAGASMVPSGGAADAGPDPRPDTAPGASVVPARTRAASSDLQHAGHASRASLVTTATTPGDSRVTCGAMTRDIYDEDHEAFRASVKEFLDREVVPHLDEYAEGHGLSREFWLAAGKQGFLGLEIPEQYGGSEAGDYRFNAVLTEELAKVNMTLPSCVGIHADIVAPYLVHLTTDEQKERWLPEVLLRRAAHRDRHDRARRRLRPGQPQDHRGPRRRRLDHQRLQDLHHQRRQRRPGGGRRPHQPGEEGQGHLASSASTPRSTGFSVGRVLDKVGQDESDTAELAFEDVRVSNADLIGPLDTGFISMMQFLPAGAPRLGGHQPRPRRADPRGDHPVRQGPQGVRPADRQLPAQRRS